MTRPTSKSDFLQRIGPLKINNALLILLLFFAFMPAAFRAARMSLKDKENDVKDWLPSDFPETAELSWFASHFAGESFVVATWPGCNAEDQRLKLFQQKLEHESEQFDPSQNYDQAMAGKILRARQIAAEYGLILSGNDYFNWGGQAEKWLSDGDGQWFYILPNGKLFRWEESISGPAAAIRSIRKKWGTYQLAGQPITAFGSMSPEGDPSPFYKDPALFAVPLFSSVQTGESVVDQLASPGGPLWPVDLTDASKRAVVARRLAMSRLTGSLFAPAVPAGFEWTGAAVVEMIPAESKLGESTPVDSTPGDDADRLTLLAQQTIDSIVADRFDGDLGRLRSATTGIQADVWYEVFDAIEQAPPRRLTAVVVTLSDKAKENLGHVLGRGVMDLPRGRLLHLADQSGLSAAMAPSMAPPPFNRAVPDQVGAAPPLRLGGPPVDNVAIDEEGTVTLVRLVGYSLLLGIVLSYLCFRSVKITIMVFIVGGSAALVSMAMVRWTGGRVDAILMSMPSLVYVLGLSGAIHVVNYYRDEVRQSGEAGAAGRALRHAIMPCTLASVTTAIGLISLSTSNLAPISNFGLYAAVGVIATLAVLFSYLPAALQTFKPEVIVEKVDQAERPEGALAKAWAGFGTYIARHHALVAVVCLLCLAASAVGLKDLKTSVQLLKLFDQDSRIIRDYAWLETNFGKLVPMEVILRTPTNPESTDLQPLQRLEAVARVRRVLTQSLGEPGLAIVGQATAADTFLPPLPEASNRYSPVRAKFQREIFSSLDQLQETDMLRIEHAGEENESELWRISLRVAALSDVDYGAFINTLRQSVAPVLRAYQVRSDVLGVLADSVNRDGGDSIDRSNPTGRVLVIGSDRPLRIEDSNLLVDGEVDPDAVFMASLGEILDAIPAERLTWQDVDEATAARLRQDDKFAKYLQSFDVVLWTGDGPLTVKDLGDAATLLRLDQVVDAEPVHVNMTSGKIEGEDLLPEIAAVYTGVVPVIYKAQRTLLTSLTESIAMAFVLIALVMFVLLNPGRSLGTVLRPVNVGYGVAAGMVSMIPNVFPVLFVFGLLCHLDISIDIGTMMVASVAMGVAVDDTIHFLTWFRTNLDSGMQRVEAVIETYRRVGPAMTQTTLVGGMGLFVFALSTFTPTQRFGTLMLVMLVTALVGDLILLPALLAGPLGRVFKPRSFARGVSDTSGDDADTTAVSVDGPSPAQSGTPLERSGDGGEEHVDPPELPQLRLHYPSDESPPMRKAK